MPLHRCTNPGCETLVADAGLNGHRPETVICRGCARQIAKGERIKREKIEKAEKAKQAA